jgi:hypothetical protein
MDDGKTAEHGVAELVAAQLPGRRHHPAHSKRCTECFELSTAMGPRPDHFL